MGAKGFSQGLLWEQYQRFSGPLALLPESDPGGAPGAIPEVPWERSRRCSGSDPGGASGAIPEVFRALLFTHENPGSHEP